MSASPQFPGLPPGWVEETSYLANETIFYRQFRRTDSTRRGRGLFIVHGFGEQSDRFLHFPHYLHTSVDIIGLLDLPGHGKSTGQRGHIDSFSKYSEASLIAFRHFEAQGRSYLGDLQLHLMGASMGGLVSLRTLLREPNLKLKSCIVAEAMLDIAVKVPWLKEKFGLWIAPIWGKGSEKRKPMASLTVKS